MTWFFLALISPILLTLVNHLDKYLIEKYFKGGGVGALMIFSSLAGVLVLPIAYFLSDINVLSIPVFNIFILLIIGILSSFAIFSYLFALEDEETSIVIPFYQTGPIFALILGYFFLKEEVNFVQLIGIPVIILGSLILSIDIGEYGKCSFKKKPLILILVSSLLFSINALLFKAYVVESSFWTSVFWEYFALFLVGLFIFTFFKKNRVQFLSVFKMNKGRVLSLNITNEIIVLIAYLAVEYAVLLAPVALVLVIDSFQPIFILFWALLFTKFFPHLISEDEERISNIKKISGIIIIVLGAILINYYN